MKHSPNNDEYWDWFCSEEGRRENQAQMEKFRADEKKRWHAGRFHRDADRHDRRIPFEH